MPEGEKQIIQSYNPSSGETKKIKEIYDKMQVCQDLRNRSFHYFDDVSLEEYINESVKRWNSYLPPTHEDDWRVKTFMPETRNKSIAILSFFAAQRMRVELNARDKENKANKQLSDVLQGLYDYSMDAEKGDMKFFYAALEAVVKGTVIVYEGYKYQTRDIKKIKRYNFETQQVEYEKEQIVSDDFCYQQIIPLEDFFISNFYEPDIQKQPYVIVRERLTNALAKDRYGKNPKFKYIKQKSELTEEKEGEMFFYEAWQDRIENDGVEILHYYNKWDDEYHILANGILLTSLENPLIFDHKEYPFVKAIFEPMAVDFFYGKSLPQKVISEQDVINTLYNMMLDRSYLSIMPFFFTSLQDEIEEDEIGPLQRIQVSDPSKIREATIAPIGSGDIEMLKIVRDSISKSSVDPSQQGQTSSETATAVLQARESAVRLMGLFTNFMAWMVYDQAKLRIANLLQFGVKPTSIKDATGKFKLKEYRIENQKLSNGQQGVRIIRLMEDTKLMPTKGMVQEEVDRNEEMNEIIYVSPRYLREIDYTIEIIPNSSIPETKALRKALGIEYMQTVLANFGDMVNKEKLFDYINELFDQNTEQMKKQEPQTQLAPDAEQMIKGLMGGEGARGRQALPQMTEQLVGSPEQSLKQVIQ